MTIYLVNHPGREPNYGNAAIGQTITVPWNSGPSHHRKFIERGGICLNGGTLIPDVFRFWGEYEPKSEATIISTSSSPRAVHKTLYPVGPGNCIPNTANVCCMNTDPYVFGDEFYYYCCKRYHKNYYSTGDIILFGTVPWQSKQFFVDTVFVVKDIRPINLFPNGSNYWKCALDPRLFKNGQPYDTVIVGQMYAENQQEFCFVPSVSSNNTAVKRPFKAVIDVTKYGFPKIQSYRYNPSPVQSQKSPFPSIMTEIKNQSFDIVTYINHI